MFHVQMEPESLMRYKQKISEIGFDPYNIDVSPHILPTTVDYSVIFNYMIEDLCFISKSERNCKKGIEGYKRFEEGWVNSLKGAEMNKFFIVHGRVSIFFVIIMNFNY